MGADMLIATLSTRVGRTVDFAAGHAAVDQLTSTEGFTFPDPFENLHEVIGNRIDETRHLDADQNLTLEAARIVAHAVITRLEQELDTREVTMIEVAGRWMHLTGGLSHGDAPTEAAQAFWELDKLPDWMLKTMNILVDADPVADALNQAADDVIDLADEDDRIRDAVNLVVNAAGHYLQHPTDDLTAAIEAGYEASPEEVTSWLTEG